MAMKSVNHFSVNRGVVGIFAAVLLSTTGCVTSPGPQQQEAPIAAFIAEQETLAADRDKVRPPDVKNTNTPAVTTLLPTDIYLPVQRYNELGEKIPYVALANPYEQQVGVIAKESVQLFIAARRNFKAERYDAAADSLHKLIKQDSNLSGPAVLLAKIAERQGDLKQAQELYSKALTINSDNVNAHIGLAKVLRLQGKYKQAQNVYANILAVWKDFPEAHANLAVLYDLYLNQPRKAQQHMEAYQFLTQGKNKQVAGWLAEVQKRTGITKSFIDNPPALKTTTDSNQHGISNDNLQTVGK